MASTIAAVTTGIGGIVQTADASGNLSLLSGTTTIVAVTSTGATVTGDLAVSGTGAVTLPVGTTAERPTPVTGMNRYNSTLVATEYYNGTAWVSSSAGAFTATGGTVTTANGFKYHTFTSSGTFTVLGNGAVEALVVAGGGGSANVAGGGGGGGVLHNSSKVLTSGAYDVIVGAGSSSSSGGNSTFGTMVALGGGSGGSGWVQYGGSGGGAFHQSPSVTIGGPSIQPSGDGTGYGNAGGGMTYVAPYPAGGGGGAGTAGGIGTVGTAGAGKLFSVSGTPTYYAGGGGGGYYQTSTSNDGGIGGGGATGVNGTANTGGGGGGGPVNNGGWGSGGSGIVIIRYAI